MKEMNLVMIYKINLSKRNVLGRKINVSRLEVSSEGDIQIMVNCGFVEA